MAGWAQASSTRHFHLPGQHPISSPLNEKVHSPVSARRRRSESAEGAAVAARAQAEQLLLAPLVVPVAPWATPWLAACSESDSWLRAVGVALPPPCMPDYHHHPALAPGARTI